MNDALMIGVILSLVFGAVVFYLYNRLSMTERKLGLFEGVLTDLKVMMDAAPYLSTVPSSMESGPEMSEFEPTPEYLKAISGPFPLDEEEVEEVEKETSDLPTKSLQIDELAGVPLTANNAISVTKLSPDLESLTLKELQALAKEKGVNVPSGTRRRTMIELLKDVSSGPSGPSGPSGSSVPSGPMSPSDLNELSGPELLGGSPLI